MYAMMRKDNVEIFFQRTDSFKEDIVFAQGLPIGGSVSFYMDIGELEEPCFFLRAKMFCRKPVLKIGVSTIFTLG